jgi:hypothetical protein
MVWQWWMIVLVILGSAVVGAFLAFCGTLLWVGKGLWR